MTRIGITTSIESADALLHADVLPYAAAVRAAGAEPVVLPNDSLRLDELMASVDGIVLGGGRDIDPSRYGQTAHALTRLVAPARDAFEIAVAAAARERRIPLLGICRGMQVANVAFGGTLIQDLPSHFGDEYVIHHEQSDDGVDRTGYGIDHYVMIEPSSRLANLIEDDEIATNSMHHQGIGTIGEGLRAVGWTHDGVIEAMEPAFDHPFYFLVEWHPEELMDEPSGKLFAGLTRAANDAKLARASSVL